MAICHQKESSKAPFEKETGIRANFGSRQLLSQVGKSAAWNVPAWPDLQLFCQFLAKRCHPVPCSKTKRCAEIGLCASSQKVVPFMAAELLTGPSFNPKAWHLHKEAAAGTIDRRLSALGRTQGSQVGPIHNSCCIDTFGLCTEN